MPSYNAQVIPKSSVPNREHCSAHRSQITTIGRNQGQQVRVQCAGDPADSAGVGTFYPMRNQVPAVPHSELPQGMVKAVIS